MRCRKCGKDNPEGSQFCGYCGEALQQDNMNLQTKMNGGEDKKEQKKDRGRKGGRKWIWAAGAVLVIGVAAASFFITRSVQERQAYDDNLASGEKYLEELDYENAEASYLKAIEIDPKQERPYVALAQMYMDQGEIQKAKDILEQGEKNVPEENRGGSKEADNTGDGEEEKGIPDLIEEIENVIPYQWVTEPTVEADNIEYVKSNDFPDFSQNELYLQKNSEYAVVRTGESYGLIGFDGQMPAELEYVQITDFVGSSYLMYLEEEQYEPAFNGMWSVYLFNENTGEITPAEGLGGDYDPNGYYYYCDGLHNWNESYSYGNYQLEPPENAIPVRQTESLHESFDSRDNSGLESWQTQIGDSKYAVYYQDQLVTDFIYEECGSESDGLLAVMQDGKWGYVNTEGEVVIPIEYDGSWKGLSFNDPATGELKEMDYCYAFSGGYVPVCKDGEWELRDTEGNTVILAGTFEEIRPVQDGRCWVKKDGKWGVIELEDGEASETQNNQEKEVAEDDQRSEAVTTLSEDEIMTEVVDHLNQELLEEGSGTYSIFRAETQQTDTEYVFMLRYAMSDEEAEAIIERGGSPSANQMAGTVTVNKETMDAVYEDTTGEEVFRWNLITGE